MARKDDLSFDLQLTLDTRKVSTQLKALDKHFKPKELEVRVKFDKNSAAALDRLTQSINALKQSGKGLDQFNIDLIDLRQNLSRFSSVPSFAKTAKSIDQLGDSLRYVTATSKQMGPTNEVFNRMTSNLMRMGQNTKNLGDLGTFLKGFASSLNAVSKVAPNIDKVEQSLSRLGVILNRLLYFILLS